ncbi:hypothetical protein GQ472_03505 [archaeon]|nr:hypothetical protein [archaeon]
MMLALIFQPAGFQDFSVPLHVAQLPLASGTPVAYIGSEPVLDDVVVAAVAY